MPAKHEIPRSTRKPWPQKGTGRARHGTRRSPLFIGGVKIHGPKGPETHFYMLPHAKRVAGLCCTLSVKLAQVNFFLKFRFFTDWLLYRVILYVRHLHNSA